MVVYSGLSRRNRSLGWNLNRDISAGSGIAGPFYSELNPEPKLIYFPGTGAEAMQSAYHNFPGAKGLKPEP